jgi:hypothetical protein
VWRLCACGRTAATGEDIWFYTEACDLYGNRQTSDVDEFGKWTLLIYVPDQDAIDFNGDYAAINLLNHTRCACVSVTSKPGEPGIYMARYRSPLAGQNKVDVRFDNVTLAGGPFVTDVRDHAADTQGQKDDLDRARSVVAGAADWPGPTVLEAGVASYFTVTLRNQFDENKKWVSKYGALLAVLTTLPGGPSFDVPLLRQEILDSYGQVAYYYNGQILLRVAGIYSIRCTIGGEETPAGIGPAAGVTLSGDLVGSELFFSVVPAETWAAEVTLRNVGITAGDLLQVEVASRDCWGNLQDYWPVQGFDEYEVVATMTQTSGGKDLPALPTLPAKVRSLKEGEPARRVPGRYLAELRLTLSGSYMVTVMLPARVANETVLVGEGQLEAIVEAGPRVLGAHGCEIYGPGTTEAIVGVVARTNVYLLDAFGNHAVPGVDEEAPRILATAAITGVRLTALTTVRDCFCAFPYTYNDVPMARCTDGTSAVPDGFCGTVDNCGTTGSRAAGFSTFSYDACRPAGEELAIWQLREGRYDLQYNTRDSGELILHVSVDDERCATINPDVRNGGRLLITEIYYNPPDVPLNNLEVSNHSDYIWQLDGTIMEFIEVQNVGNANVNMYGYHFTNGIRYVFGDTTIPPGGFVVVARDAAQMTWDSIDCPVLGNYKGTLSNNGERITLSPPHTNHSIDSVRYNDFGDWPQQADGGELRTPPHPTRDNRPDGYFPGSTLERASDSFFVGQSEPKDGEEFFANSDDGTLWMGSIVAGGTPCKPYPLLGEPLFTRITTWRTVPVYPTPEDEVEVLVHISGPGLAENPPRAVTLLWENTVCEAGAFKESMFEVFARRVKHQPKTSRKRLVRYEDTLVFSTTIRKLPSESFVRMTVDVLLADEACTSIRLPHVSTMPPFMSYFVHSAEHSPTVLPRLYLIGENFASALHQPPSKFLQGLPAVGEPGCEPDVDDGCRSATGAYANPTSPAQIAVAGAFQGKVSAAIIVPPLSDAEHYPLVFDGALVRQAESGHKVHFMKHNSFQDYTTLNCIFEFPGKDGLADGGSGGMAGPSMENIGLGFFRSPPFNSVITPIARWFRTTLFKRNKAREDAQRIVTEQVMRACPVVRGVCVWCSCLIL